MAIQINSCGDSPVLQFKTVNSSISDQTILPDNQYDGLSGVKINKLNTSQEQIRLYDLMIYDKYFEYKKLSSLNEGFSNPVRSYVENYEVPLSKLIFLKHYNISYNGNMTVQNYYYDSTTYFDCMEFYFPNNINTYIALSFSWSESTGTIYNSFSFSYTNAPGVSENGNFRYSEEYTFNTRLELKQDKIIFKSNTNYFQNHSLSTTSGIGTLNIVTM